MSNPTTVANDSVCWVNTQPAFSQNERVVFSPVELHDDLHNDNTAFLTDGHLLAIEDIYAEPQAMQSPRGKQILAKFPDARIHETPSHWLIPEINGNADNMKSWNGIKSTVLVIGEKKQANSCRPNGRSTDFIAPSHASGCAMACNYCYVARRKGYANPITHFTNIEKILATLSRHIKKHGQKTEANQCHPSLWTYDIGENNDCSVDAHISDNVKDIIDLFAKSQTAMASFATKWVNKGMLDYNPQGHTRIRFSLMPHEISKVVDVRCASVKERVKAINDFVEAGYEVHVNFSPVIIYDGWEQDWQNLMVFISDTLNEKSKAQLKAEVIMLTHNADLHEKNMRWHPKGENYLWRPELQQRKLSQNGMWNLRYRNNWKRNGVNTITSLMAEHMPYCGIRYAF